MGQAVVEVVQTRLCPRCGEDKPRNDWRPSDWAAAVTKGWCRSCRKTYEKTWRDGRPVEIRQADRRVRTDRERERGRRLRESDPRAYADKMRLWNYGLTAERFDQMMAEQQGVCVIPMCGRRIDTDEPRICHVDHDHSCCPQRGKSCGNCIRGLICRDCNIMLGMSGDNPDRLLGAALYLLQHSGGG